MFRNRFHHTHNDFVLLLLLKVDDLLFYSSCIFVFKSINGLSHPVNYFNFTNNANYNLRNMNNLRAPFKRTTQGQSSPSIYCCNNWNSLPENFKNIMSFVTFKRSIKDYILNSYNNSSH